MNRGDRSSFFSLSLSFSSGYYKTRFQRKAKDDEEEEEEESRRWKTSDVCPRGIVIFIGLQLSRGFSPSHPPFLAAVSFQPREKPAAMKIRCPLFATKRVSDVRLGVSVVFRTTSSGRDREATDREATETSRVPDVGN